MRRLVFQIVTVLALPAIFGLNGIWFAVVAAEFLSFPVTVIFLEGVPLHFIPGQAAPDYAAAPLLSFRFAPLQQRLRRLAHP